MKNVYLHSSIHTFIFTLCKKLSAYFLLFNSVIKLRVGGEKIMQVNMLHCIHHIHFINDNHYTVFTGFRLSWLFSMDTDPVHGSKMPCGNRQFANVSEEPAAPIVYVTYQEGRWGPGLAQSFVPPPPPHIKHHFSAWLTLLP
jgi:hypothetical protein